MSSPHNQHHTQDGYNYSTLEVDDSRLPETVPQQQPPGAAAGTDYTNYPEVRPDTNSYPEVVPSEYHGYQEVKIDDVHAGEREAALPAGAAGAAAIADPRICGVKKRTFWILVATATVIVIAIIVGVVAGTVIPSSKSDNDGSAESDNSTVDNVDAMALSPNTKLASANFTDGLGNNNYIIAYQLASRAIYISIYNTSHGEWVVSPVIDGSTDVSLDDVMDGTSLGIDVYWHAANQRDVHLYWQDPNSALRLRMYRSRIPTTEPAEPSKWEDPYDVQDRYSGKAGTALGAYGRQCDDCTGLNFFFWQGTEGAFHGAWRTVDATDGWGDITFTKDVQKPVSNSSLAVSHVPAASGTASIDLFYQSSSGVLTHIVFDGEGSYRAEALPRDDLGTRASIVAFSTGSNETDSDNPEPIGFQVLTVDRDDDAEGSRGVHLTYFKDDSWTAGDDVASLSDCTAHGMLAANHGRRVYCVVGSDTNSLEIIEWSWAATSTDNLAEYNKYNRVGAITLPKRE